MTDFEADVISRLAALTERVEALNARLTEDARVRDKALSTALMAMDKRLEGMNELREDLREQAATFLPREQYLLQHEGLSRQVHDFGVDLAALRLQVGEGTAKQSARYGLYAIIGTLVGSSVIGLWLHILGKALG
jgi:hypothetical protein